MATLYSDMVFELVVPFEWTKYERRLGNTSIELRNTSGVNDVGNQNLVVPGYPNTGNFTKEKLHAFMPHL